MNSMVMRIMSMAGGGRYIRYIMLVGLLAVPLMAVFAFGGSLKSKIIIGTITFVTLLVLLGIFLLIMSMRRKKKGNQLSKALQKNAGSGEVSGIESMRSNFEEGVDKLRKAGKNVYDLPWFLLAGQAGSGKTEAIRRSHSKEDFPPGLNDLMQGVGGTLNMNWWFTNLGIVLDTAGRVFEEKIETGKTSEWQEFLKMLKRVRKNTPINGFLLAIPADSLIRDDVSEIEKKASHVAEQITLVQNVLGVRFPVFILITKSDFIPGFREFVGNITEPNLQQQMLGWSNPNGLDEPFEPEHVDKYLEDVITKLRKRRLTYLLDPRAADGKKRLDDLDALFAFPEELKSAVPNLRRYIEIVFSLNPWSQKPLFIRGIYFTSSLQQGDALDKAIAEVMGKNLGDLALSSFKKETPLFLRDSFFQKIYKETGLVTNSGEVKGSMRRRTMMFGGTCVVGILLVLAAAIFGSSAFRKSIGNEYSHWQFAESQYQESMELDRQYDWGRPIVYDTGIDDTFETEKDVTFEVTDQTYTLTTYLERMSIFAESDLEIPKVFSLLKFFDDVFTGDRVDRKEAFRHLYEDAVILPILDNGRKKLKGVSKENWSDLYASGLHALIQIQILLNQTERDSDYAAKFYEQLDELYYFLTEERLGSKFEEIYAGVFTDSYVDSSNWPNEDFSQSYAPISTLEDERLASVANGLSLWIGEIGDIRVKQEEDMKQLAEVLKVLELVGQVENGFLNKATANTITNMRAINELAKEHANFVDSIKDLTVEGQDFTFTGYYLNQVNQAKETVDSRVNDLNEGVNTTSKGDGMLSRAILDRVETQREDLVQSFERVADPELIKRFEEADRNFLDAETGIEARIAFYRELAAYLQNLKKVELEDWEMGAAILDDLRGQHKLVFAPSEKFTVEQQVNIEKFKTIADDRLEKAGIRLFKGYQRLLLAELKQQVGFPVFADADRIMTEEEISELEDNLDAIVENVSEFKSKMDPVEASEFDLMLESIEKVSEFAQTYLTPDMARESVTIILPSLEDISSESLSDTIIWRARFVQLTGFDKQRRIGNRAETLGEIDLSEGEITLLFTSTVEGEIGDVGRLRISGGWAPLQLLLRDEDKVKSAGRGKYIYRDKVSVSAYKPLAYALLLELPKELPAADEWPRIFDLKGF
jgi:hypothetical protein